MFVGSSAEEETLSHFGKTYKTVFFCIKLMLLSTLKKKKENFITDCRNSIMDNLFLMSVTDKETVLYYKSKNMQS